MRPRGSIVGPLILITLGTIFLCRAIWPQFSALTFFSDYWPYLLIVWGALQLAEITIRTLRNAPVPSNGINGGAWALVLLVSAAGIASYETRDAGAWWRNLSFNEGMDWFGETRDTPIEARELSLTGEVTRVVIENGRGNVKVTGSADRIVRLSGNLNTRAMRGSDLRHTDRQAAPVAVTQNGDTVTVRVAVPREDRHVRYSTDLDLTVPRGVKVDAAGQYGDFDINQLDGDITVSSDNAGVRLSHIGGNVLVVTRRGDEIHCEDIRGSVVLKGRNEDVSLQKITGPVMLDGAYSGTITLRELAQSLHVKNFRTSIAIGRVDGQVTMDRGSFSAERIVGPTELSTHATDVEISGFSDALVVTMDKGDLTLTPGNSPLTAPVSVSTRSGNIELTLAPNAKFNLSAETDRGEIDNEFGLPLEVRTEGKGARLHGVVGGGPGVSLNTNLGTIGIRKAGSEVTKKSRDEDDNDDVPESPRPPRV